MEEFLSLQLRLTETEFEKEVVANTVALAIDTDTGRIVYSTSKAENLFHCNVKYGLNGRPFEQLIPSYLREQHEKHFKSYLKDPQPRAMGQGGFMLLAQALDGSDPFRVSIELRPVKPRDRLYLILIIAPIGERGDA